MSIKLRLTIIISIAIFLISSLAAVMIGHTIKNKKRVDFVKAAFDSMIALDDVKKIISRQNIELADYLISAKQQDIAEFKAFTLQTEKEINKWNNAIERSLQTGLLNEDGNNKHAESLERNYTLAVDSSLKVMALSEAGNNKQAFRYLKNDTGPYKDKVSRAIERSRKNHEHEINQSMHEITASFGFMPWIVKDGIAKLKVADKALDYLLALNDLEANINTHIEKALYFLEIGNHEDLTEFRKRGLLVELSFERLMRIIELQMEIGIGGEAEDLENAKIMQNIYARIIIYLDKSIELYKKGVKLQAYKVIEEKVEPLLRGDLKKIISEAGEKAKEEFTTARKNMTHMIMNAAILYAIILACLSLFIIVFALRLVRSISSSITLLKSGTYNISTGNLNHRININTGDEFENLADSLNRMTDDLQEYRDNLQCTVKELEERNSELKDTNNELEVAHYEVGTKTEMLGRLNTRLANEVVERKKQEERIAKMAYYDSLTHLPNRTMFETRLQQVLSINERTDNLCALMFIDVDNFKRINDTLGHGYGDKLLIEVSERMNNTVRKSDIVMSNDKDSVFARLGGDEFTLLLSVIKDREDAGVVAGRIQEALSKPVIIENYELFVNLSMGIAIFPDDGRDMQTLLKNADTAMYYTKEHGKNGFTYYRQSMGDISLSRLTFEGDLRRALENEEFILHYQPVIDSVTGKIAGLEALIRWEHPEKGRISPLDFVPAAEQTGLIVPLSNWVITSALKQSIFWKKEGIKNMPISVNLTSHQFHQQNFSDELSRMIEESGLKPEDMHVEITESTIMENTEIVETNLNEISKMGFKLILDDFGTGYSSLSYLKRLPIHTIKLDRSFVMDINTDPDTAVISKAIIAMAHSLGLNVIAEGIENEQQVKMLKNQGCHEFQGYLFSPPLSAEELTTLLLRDKEETGVLCKI